MAILSAIKNYGSNVLGGAKIVGGAVSNTLFGSTPKQPANVISSVPNQTLYPNISTPQGIGQTQPSGSVTLLNQQGQPTGSTISPSGVGSTPLPSAQGSSGSSNLAGALSALNRAGGGSSGGGLSDGLPSNIRFDNSPGLTLNRSGTTAGLSGSQAPTYGTQENPAGTQVSPGLAANQAQTTVGGRTGIETSQFASSIPRGQTSLPQDNSSQQERAANIKFGQDAQAQREAQIQDVSAQIAALQSQLEDKQDQQALRASLEPLGRAEQDPDISRLQSQQSALEQEYQRLLLPTQEEIEAQQLEDALVAAEAQVNADLNQKITDVNREPISQGFLSGFGTTFNKDAAAKLQTIGAQKLPLQLQLARLAQTRQAALGVQKDKLSSAREATNRAFSSFDTLTNRAEDRRKEELKTTNNQNVTSLRNALNASKFQGPEADGRYADPNLYLANYRSWVQSGQSPQEFFRLFPPSTYINPANTFLPREIMQFVKQPSSTRSSGSTNLITA